MAQLNRITADEARMLGRVVSDNLFIRIMNTAYESIRRTAHSVNYYSLDGSRFSATLTNRILEAFREDGYKTKYNYDIGKITIYW